MTHFTKADVTLRRGGLSEHEHPAINVKCHHPFADKEKVMARFGCSRETARQALQNAFEAAVESFWPTKTEMARDIFEDNSLNVHSEGRNNGWLVVDGLPDLDEWDARLLAKWVKFQRLVKEDMDFLSSEEVMMALIEKNGWASR